jgi:hypothetical protein
MTTTGDAIIAAALEWDATEQALDELDGLQDRDAVFAKLTANECAQDALRAACAAHREAIACATREHVMRQAGYRP